jgi:transposase InsO family protein
VACFRFEQISPLLDPKLTAAERRRCIATLSKQEVQWPCGRFGKVSKRSLRRWLSAYFKDPRIEALQPKPPPSKPPGARMDPEVLAYALALLEQESDRSLYYLRKMLLLRFPPDKVPSRATLHRGLQAQPRYKALRKRARGEKRIRKRFQASEPHQIWHADAKAPFTVCFRDGVRRRFQVLSMIDDATRAALAAFVVSSESLAAAVRTFRHAAARWGLPDSFYSDRGSCYDSDVFRGGLALLGVRRIDTRSRNPQAHGKIESYHRALQRWFVTELKHHVIRDQAHLQELLDGVIHMLYQPHHHRELGRSPQEALGEQRSARLVSYERLQEAFLEECSYVVCPRTATIRINKTPFRVPVEYRNHKKITVLLDPEYPETPYLRMRDGTRVALCQALTRPSRKQPPPGHPCGTGEAPAGPLTPLFVEYRGRVLPKAYPGFGLPEIYAALAQALGRSVPADEEEASHIVAFLKAGPFEPTAFHSSLHATLRALGPGRPLRLILERLAGHIVKHPKHKESKR